jgi:DNA modification methylase
MTINIGTSLDGDLDFVETGNISRLHNFHSFPAKFPPGLPQKIINDLTNPGDIVLDPMCGSGTTLVEALLSERIPIGFDIDPLAILISTVKTTRINSDTLLDNLDAIIQRANKSVLENPDILQNDLQNRWDRQTKEFVDYWFSFNTQIELVALIREIEKLPSPDLVNFFRLVFSSIIITKSGGVSLALDLAHTRPHKAKTINQKIVSTYNYSLVMEKNSNPYSTKTIRSALSEFKKKAVSNIRAVNDIPERTITPAISLGDARQLALCNDSIDLVVTSPPYASNAIDYMRAHKFSLVWFGNPISDLSKTRSEYIGSETLTRYDDGFLFPQITTGVIKEIEGIDSKKARVVSKYYQESKDILTEMYRVIKPGKNMIYVVGTSIIKGIDIRIAECLTELGQEVGFSVHKVASRAINRDKRMMPISRNKNSNSVIEQRMQNEYVIGFHKPE